MMKRTLCLLITAVMLLSAAVPVFAANAPEITVSEWDGAPGAEAEISVSLNNNPGIASLKLIVRFDPDALELLSVSPGREFLAVPGAQHAESFGDGRATINWLCVSGQYGGDAEFAALRFRVRESAVNGSYPISVTYDPYDAFDQQFGLVSFTVRGGEVRVTGGAEAPEPSAEPAPQPSDEQESDDTEAPEPSAAPAPQPSDEQVSGGDTEADDAETGSAKPDDTENGDTEAIDAEPDDAETGGTEAGPDPAPLPAAFTDVLETDWFYGDVLAMYEKGHVKGVSETEFSPQSTMNRAMVVQVLHRMSGTPKPGAGRGFPDVTQTAWYYDAVSWAAGQGIVQGYEDGCFYPMAAVTREQFAALLYRYAQFAGLPADTGVDLSSFADAGQIQPWAEDSMRWANGAGILRGRTETLLSPGETATRAEAVVMLNRFLKLLDAAGAAEHT